MIPFVVASGLLVGLVLTGPKPLPGSSSGFGPAGSAETFPARVMEILEEGMIDLGDVSQTYQILRVEMLEGPWRGVFFEVDYGRRQIRPSGITVRPGEKILVAVSEDPGGFLQAYFVDFVRTPALAWLLGAFVVFSILVSGWKGLRSLLAMALSLAVILWYLIPRVLRGDDPLSATLTSAFVILACTLYLVYGWTLKTHAAVLGTFLALVLTGFLATVFVSLTRLTGFGSEQALFLSQASATPINLQGLVLGGVLVGALGVLDDLVITQAAAVFELHLATPGMRYRELLARGMRIGRDHVAATVNTLVLAYAGASLPLLLLVSLSGEQWLSFLSREFVAEEVVRTLVGSLGLMAAVPITTALSCLVALHHGRLGRLRRFLGPFTLSDVHEGGLSAFSLLPSGQDPDSADG